MCIQSGGMEGIENQILPFGRVSYTMLEDERKGMVA